MKIRLIPYKKKCFNSLHINVLQPSSLNLEFNNRFGTGFVNIDAELKIKFEIRFVIIQNRFISLKLKGNPSKEQRRRRSKRPVHRLYLPLAVLCERNAP